MSMWFQEMAKPNFGWFPKLSWRKITAILGNN